MKILCRDRNSFRDNFPIRSYVKGIVEMDIFVEQIVKKEVTGKDWAIRTAIGLGMGILLAVSLFVFLFIMPILGLPLFVGVIWGGWYLITNTDCEYEYIVTNGEIDIDKIIAKRKRVRLITAKASAFEGFGEYKDAPEAENGVTVVSAVGVGETANEAGEIVPLKTYYADLKHPSAGNVRLIFCPEQRVIDALSPFFSGQLKIELSKRH